MFQSKPDNRPVFEFDLTDELVALDDPYIKKSFGLVKLRMEDEVKAATGVSGNAAKLSYNMAKASLVEVDGRRLNRAEGEEETVLNHMDPAIRAIILDAYADLCSVEEDAAKKVRASRKIKVA